MGPPQRGRQDEGLREAQMPTSETSRHLTAPMVTLGKVTVPLPLAPGPSPLSWGSKTAHHTNLTGLDSGWRERSRQLWKQEIPVFSVYSKPMLELSSTPQRSLLVGSPRVSFRGHMLKRQVFIWTVGGFQCPSSSLLMSVVLRTKLCRHRPCLLSPLPALPGPWVFQSGSGIAKFRKRSTGFLSVACCVFPMTLPPCCGEKRHYQPSAQGKEKKKPNPSSLSLLGFRVIVAFTFLLWFITFAKA